VIPATILIDAGLKVADMLSTVATEKREDWGADQVDKGVEMLICNPELVKTGLDLIEFPSIGFCANRLQRVHPHASGQTFWVD
jgi:hypothetical protein